MINWKITNLEYILEKGNLKDIVKAIHYTVEAEDQEGNFGFVQGVQEINIDEIEESSFLPFGEITATTAKKWLKDSLGHEVESIEQSALDAAKFGNYRFGVGLPNIF